MKQSERYALVVADVQGQLDKLPLWAWIRRARLKRRIGELIAAWSRVS